MLTKGENHEISFFHRNNFCLSECHWDLPADEDTANEWNLVARYSANIPLSQGERGLLMHSEPDDSMPLSLEEWEDLPADEDTANEWKPLARYAANIPLSLWERGQG